MIFNYKKMCYTIYSRIGDEIMKNGFTLVELLAVIIILSAIALITTIETGTVIKKSKNNLSDVQISKIEEAAKVYYLKEGIGYDTDSFSQCISVEKLLEKGYIEAEQVLDPKTKKAVTGSVVISYNSNNYSYKYQEGLCKYCEAVTEESKTTGNVPNGNYLQGDEYICEVKMGVRYHFFVISTENDMINLILDRNIHYDSSNDVSMLTDNNHKGYTAFISKEDYNAGENENKFDDLNTNKTDKGPITAMNYLYNATKDWNYIPNIYIDYTDEDGIYKGIKTVNNITEIRSQSGNVTAQYENLKSRLPYKSEIPNCFSGDFSELCLSIYNYLGEFNNKDESYITKVGKGTEIQGISGYLTFSAANPDQVEEKYKELSPVYYVWRAGKIGYTAGDDNDSFGVRPVISVPKSFIK